MTTIIITITITIIMRTNITSQWYVATGGTLCVLHMRCYLVTAVIQWLLFLDHTSCCGHTTWRDNHVATDITVSCCWFVCYCYCYCYLLSLMGSIPISRTMRASRGEMVYHCCDTLCHVVTPPTLLDKQTNSCLLSSRRGFKHYPEYWTWLRGGHCHLELSLHQSKLVPY